MSSKYPGGIISKTAPTPSGPYSNDTAPGVWTLEQQAYWQKLGQWPTAGNVNPSAFIENLFSTYLYTGNGSTQTITNGIDLAGEGGLVWIKARTDTSGGATSHALVDTVRGSSKWLSSNASGSQATNANLVTGFTSSGFSVGTAPYFANESSIPYVSWTFRKQPKFFDVVTYTGNGTAGTTISHSLGSTPGCIMVKKTSGADAWAVYHRGVNSGTGNGLLVLNTTAAQNVNGKFWWGDNTNFIAPTSTNFTVSNDGQVNASGETYVAYLFAHDAGGFGLAGTDNVISCGYAAGGTTVNLGYEPQWVLVKNPNSASNWLLVDNMRGMPANGGGAAKGLLPNTSDAESDWGGYVQPTSTGFYNGVDAIYIAIRRGPMAVPTVGTSVFSPIARSGNGSVGVSVTGAGFPPDLVATKARNAGNNNVWADRLRGIAQLYPDATYSEGTSTNEVQSYDMDGMTLGSASGVNGSGATFINWLFRRAPGFFDEVCWSTTGSAQTINHNLGVVPELMIRKVRNGTWEGWMTYAAAIGNTKILYLDQTAGQDTNNGWNNQTPTATQFFVNNTLSGYTMVTYLFATCAGVSKVGSYTGTGTTLQIDCGFTGGARFVLIKRTDSTGDWYVWDSARGIVAGNDPYLLLNSTAAEVTGTDYVDTYSAGFEISSTAPSAINASGGTFIFLAIA